MDDLGCYGGKVLEKSRVKWIEVGDSNSAYFHKMVVAKRASNQIHYLIDSSGLRIDSPAEVQSHCVNYFQVYLGKAWEHLTATKQLEI